MAQKEVITYICDNCGGEGESEIDAVLPNHWVTVQYLLHHGTLETVDLCDLCQGASEKALEERRNG